MTLTEKLALLAAAVTRAQVVLEMLSEMEPAELDLARGIARREALGLALVLKETAQ